MRGLMETNPKPLTAFLPPAIATPSGSDSSGPSSSPTMEFSRMLSTSWPSSSTKPSSMFLFTYGPREPHYRTVLRTSLSTRFIPSFAARHPSCRTALRDVHQTYRARGRKSVLKCSFLSCRSLNPPKAMRLAINGTGYTTEDLGIVERAATSRNDLVPDRASCQTRQGRNGKSAGFPGSPASPVGNSGSVTLE